MKFEVSMDRYANMKDEQNCMKATVNKYFHMDHKEPSNHPGPSLKAHNYRSP